MIRQQATHRSSDDISNKSHGPIFNYGYTTLVDLGVAVNHPVFEDMRQAPLHPDLYGCGDALILANGYPMSFWPPETRFDLSPNFIYDPKQASSIPPGYKPEYHTVAAAVARVKNSGGICVKTFFERGFGPNACAPHRHQPPRKVGFPERKRSPAAAKDLSKIISVIITVLGLAATITGLPAASTTALPAASVACVIGPANDAIAINTG